MHFHLNTMSLRGGLRPTWQSVPFCQTLFGVGGRIRLHFCPCGRNRGSARSNPCRQQSTGLLRLSCSNPSTTTQKKNNTGRCWSFSGGGGRIRTIEAIRSRFTVCPLWPLGNSPIFNSCLNGTGRRTRTPDLLITNQLLYQLSSTGGSNRTGLL